ncbi:hypothetical protein FOFC_16727 [Fusarium oxysporum]|nr:hypothetical protein FOFC_16727 [Fusarium oxysporum]
MEMLIGGIGISQQITSPTYKRGNHNLFLHQGSVGLAIATVITRMLFFRTRKGPEEKKGSGLCYRLLLRLSFWPCWGDSICMGTWSNAG